MCVDPRCALCYEEAGIGLDTQGGTLMKANTATWIGMCVFAFGCAASPGWAATDDHASDHEELRAMMRTVKDAVNNNRLEEVLPLLDRDFSLTMVDQTLITEPARLIAYFRERFE